MISFFKFATAVFLLHFNLANAEGDSGVDIDGMRQEAQMQMFQYTNNSITDLSLRFNSFIAPNAAVQGTWTSAGPSDSKAKGQTWSGRVNTILQSPIDSDTMYVVFAGGGMWKSPNFFDPKPQWTPLTDSLLSTCGGYADISSASNTLYYGLGDFDSIGIGGFMYTSSDGGSTWKNKIYLQYASYNASRIFSVRVAISSILNDIVIVATDIGIFRSVDSGKSYSNVFSISYPYDFYHQFPYTLAKTSIGWITCIETQLFQSIDSGATWNASWTNNFASITGNQARYVTFGLAADGENVVYAQVTSIQNLEYHMLDVFKSQDGGVTWVALGVNANYRPTNPTDDQKNLDVTGNQGFYNEMVLVDSTDVSRNTVYVGGNLAIIKTVNGGASWSILTTWTPTDNNTLPLVHADYHAAKQVKSASGTNYIIIGNDGGLYYTYDGGLSFSYSANVGISTNLVQYIVEAPDNLGNYIIGMQDCGTWIRQDKSSLYTELASTGDGEGEAESSSGITIVSSYYNDFICIIGGISVTCNDGINQTESLQFNTNVEYVKSDEAFYTITKDSVYVMHVSSQSTISLSWVKFATNGVQPGLSSIKFSGTYHSFDASSFGIAICKANNDLAISLDPISWSEITLPFIFSCASPLWTSSFNLTTLYVGDISMTRNVNRVIKTTDYGATWTSCASGLPDIPVVHLVASPDESVLYVGMYIGIYTSTNQGESWSPLGTSLPNVGVYSILPSESGKIAIATYGRGVWEFSYPSNGNSNNANTVSTKKLSSGSVALITIFTILGAIALVYFVYRYKRGNDSQDKKPLTSPILSNASHL